RVPRRQEVSARPEPWLGSDYLLRARARRAVLRAAVFLWITPLVAALSRARAADATAARAAAASVPWSDSRTERTRFRSRVLIALLRCRRFSLGRCRFNADACCATGGASTTQVRRGQTRTARSRPSRPPTGDRARRRRARRAAVRRPPPRARRGARAP